MNQSGTAVTGWEEDKGDVEGGGAGYIWGQQMPTEATGDLCESIPPIPMALLQLVVSRFILSDTYHYFLSCDL